MIQECSCNPRLVRGDHLACRVTSELLLLSRERDYGHVVSLSDSGFGFHLQVVLVNRVSLLHFC